MKQFQIKRLHPFTLLAKPTGAACNLACEYCFYLGKDSLYPGSPLRMTDQVLKAYIKQLLASSTGQEISISWQGGEPTLMGLDFFRRSVELVKRYRRPGQVVTYTMQTNGTRLDEEWCEFFRRHNFLIGLSMDGPANMHDAYRLNKGGEGTFDQVKQSWELLNKHQVDTNILCTVHAANALHPLEVYRFFRDGLGARFIQFLPIVERLALEAAPTHNGKEAEYSRTQLVSPRSVTPKQFGRFLIEIFDEWVQHDVGSMFIQAFDAALASWCHLPASLCIFQEVCGSSLVLEHNGDLYSCDHFVQSEHRLGNILEQPMAELANSPRQLQFGLNKRDGLPEYCRKCECLFACHGECPRNRFSSTPDGTESGLNYLCEGYHMFFKHVDLPMRRMANLIRSGRPAAEIMQDK